MQYHRLYQLFCKITTFTIFVYFLKKIYNATVNFTRSCMCVCSKKIQILRFTHVKNQNFTHPKAANLATLNATVQSTIYMYNEVQCMQSLVECTVLLSLMVTVNSAASILTWSRCEHKVNRRRL